MNATTKVKLEDITPNLTCPLCKGYFIDATTIIECLHSFCKSCIVKHLDKSEYCPVCDVQLHSSKPLSSIRSDYMLQEIVYKLVPGLFQNEMERRRKFYKENPDSIPASQMDSGQVFNESYITSDDIICLSLELHLKNNEFQDTAKRYIKCPAAVSISILKKFIQFKFDLSPEAVIDVMYGERILPDDFLLMDIAYKYSWNQNAKPLQLSYRVSGDPNLFKQEKVDLTEPAEEEEPVASSNKNKSLNGPKSLPLSPSYNNSPIPVTPSSVTKKHASSNGIPKRKEPRKPKSASSNQATPAGKTPNSPLRGRKKKKVLDTEKELSRIRASVSEAATTQQQDKEVQLRISENGVISARNVTSGEERIYVGGSKPNTGFPTDANIKPIAPKPRLLVPQQEDGKFWSANMSPSSIPRPIEPKARKIAAAKTPNGSLLAKKQPIIAKNPESPQIPPIRTERRPEDVKTGQQAQQGTKFSSNMETLKAVTLRLREELESKMNLFSAEITPIVNGAPAPKLVVKPAEPQSYPGATVHTTDLTKAKNSSYNKRLHQTTIVNGDVKFTKNLLPSSPQAKLLPKDTGKDSPKDKQTSQLTPPTGSPSKPPKFFKSRLTTALDQAPLIPAPTNGIEPHKLITPRDSPETSNTSPAAKRPKLMDGNLPSTAATGSNSVALSLPSQTSPRLPGTSNMNFNGLPINLIPYVAGNYSAFPFLAAAAANPALKNVPLFGNPFFDFTSQMHTLAQGLNGAAVAAATTTASAPLELTVTNGKGNTSSTSHGHSPQNIAQNQTPSPAPKVTATASDPEKASTSSEKQRKPIDLPCVQPPQNLIQQLGLVPTSSLASKVSRKCLSPTKIPRSTSSNVPVPTIKTPVKSTVTTPEPTPAKSPVQASPPQSSPPTVTKGDENQEEEEQVKEKSESQREDPAEAPISTNSETRNNVEESVNEVTSESCNNNVEIQCNNNNVDKTTESPVKSKSPPPPPPPPTPKSPPAVDEKRSDDSSTSA